MRLIRHITIYLLILIIILVIVDFGFDQTAATQNIFKYVYISLIILSIIPICWRLLLRRYRPVVKVLIFDIALIAFLVAMALNFFSLVQIPVLDDRFWLYIAVFLFFFRELFALRFVIEGSFISPARLFILSFAVIILTGTIILLLPNSTYTGISPVNALFTSTSAVCVTGLTVVDTGSHFTFFGQIIILILIQLGGLGIMTFTSYFSYFFKGGSSYASQLILKEITRTDKISDVFRTLRKIIILTAVIEIIGGVFIFLFLKDSNISGMKDKMFFTVFHSVSGFCNAGFSTLSDSFYDAGFRYNYPMHMTIALLFITGGLGFPILFNAYKYIKHYIINHLFPLVIRKKPLHIPWVININTRIVIITTLLLVIGGTLSFYLSEYNNTLAEHRGIGKLVTAFFGAVTPRTAGFNTVDTASLNLPTLIIIIFLMWVGASPASTGGGIKTSTLAISIMNFLSIARGRNRIEVFRREISGISVQRAFAIISLSVITIGISVLLVTLFEPDMNLTAVIFECFSAFSTVGLSQGITAELGNASKIVIIFTMFTGRISMLTILVALVKKIRFSTYRYPSEDILIN